MLRFAFEFGFNRDHMYEFKYIVVAVNEKSSIANMRERVGKENFAQF